MTSETKPQDDQPADRWPSDQSLAAYLLGEAAPADRKQIESWLAAEPDHGDHLVRLAAVVLAVSRVGVDAGACDAIPSEVTARRASAPPRTPSRVRSVAALLALAASGVLALLSVDHLRRDQSSHSQVAIAWAESRPLSSAAESDDVSNWLLDHSVDLDAAGLTSLQEPADQDPTDPGATFGFSADEPPEWLIAAVSQMHSNDRPAEPIEDKL